MADRACWSFAAGTGQHLLQGALTGLDFRPRVLLEQPGCETLPGARLRRECLRASP